MLLKSKKDYLSTSIKNWRKSFFKNVLLDRMKHKSIFLIRQLCCCCFLLLIRHFSHVTKSHIFKNLNSKLVSACVFYFSPNDSPSKTMKNVFFSSKKLFSFSMYSNFCISVFLSFFPVSHCFRGWSKKNLKFYDVINCLNKNFLFNITYFVWYLEKDIRCDIEALSIDRVLNKKHFYGKTMQKMCT